MVTCCRDNIYIVLKQNIMKEIRNEIIQRGKEKIL